MAFFNTLKTKLKRFSNKVDDYQEVVTFAQAGVDTPKPQEKEMTCVQSDGKNLVVASHDSRFSEDMVSYALEIAQRMDYGIIAVNAANLTHDVTEFFSTTHEELYKDFKQTSIKNVESFRKMAAERGLKFAHTTKFSNIDHSIDEIVKECGDIEFIISKNRDSSRVRGIVETEKRIAQRLCVYSVN